MRASSTQKITAEVKKTQRRQIDVILETRHINMKAGTFAKIMNGKMKVISGVFSDNSTFQR